MMTSFCKAVAVAAICVLQPAWAGTEQVIHSFGSRPDGNYPLANAALKVTPTGHFFGTALHGGKGANGGLGVVFLDLPPAAGASAWQHHPIYHFQGGADGYGPFNGVALGKKGVLYGATAFGGMTSPAQGCGVIYQLVPPNVAAGVTSWTETQLHRFQSTDASDGCTPYDGKLIVGATGALYGTTLSGGGAANAGTLFRLNPPAAGGTDWTETILYRWGGGGDGASPSGVISVDANRNLYGTTRTGGFYGFGTVWSYNATNGAKTILYNFKGGADGANPENGVVGPIADPVVAQYTLYGTTAAGGGAAACTNGCGTVFYLTISQFSSTPGEGILHAFAGGTDGATPAAGLTLVGGTYWGTTEAGGSAACDGGCGTVFSLHKGFSPISKWTYTEAYAFTNGFVDGAYPQSALTADAAGHLFGMTQFGGTAGLGTVFEILP